MAMSSLIPGVLFKTTGLNQSHTPTEITATTDEVKSKYRRKSIPEKKWPPESPVAEVYDVKNTATRLILLNNKMEKKSHLRVHSGRYKQAQNGEVARTVEPGRHFRSAPPFNRRKQVESGSMSSPHHAPTPSPPSAKPSRSADPSTRKLPQPPGKPKPSEWHHYSSQIDRYTENIHPHRTTQSRKLEKRLQPPPSFKKDSNWLLHPDMTLGQKLYANSIARVYDMTNMKQLKQAQYIQLIYREQQRAKDFFTPENYRKYINYLNSPRMRQFGVSAPPSSVSRNRPARRIKVEKSEGSKAEHQSASTASPTESDEVFTNDQPDVESSPVPQGAPESATESVSQKSTAEPPPPESGPKGDELNDNSEKQNVADSSKVNESPSSSETTELESSKYDNTEQKAIQMINKDDLKTEGNVKEESATAEHTGEEDEVSSMNEPPAIKPHRPERPKSAKARRRPQSQSSDHSDHQEKVEKSSAETYNVDNSGSSANSHSDLRNDNEKSDGAVEQISTKAGPIAHTQNPEKENSETTKQKDATDSEQLSKSGDASLPQKSLDGNIESSKEPLTTGYYGMESKVLDSDDNKVENSPVLKEAATAAKSEANDLKQPYSPDKQENKATDDSNETVSGSDKTNAVNTTNENDTKHDEMSAKLVEPSTNHDTQKEDLAKYNESQPSYLSKTEQENTPDVKDVISVPEDNNGQKTDAPADAETTQSLDSPGPQAKMFTDATESHQQEIKNEPAVKGSAEFSNNSPSILITTTTQISADTEASITVDEPSEENRSPKHPDVQPTGSEAKESETPESSQNQNLREKPKIANEIPHAGNAERPKSPPKFNDASAVDIDVTENSPKNEDVKPQDLVIQQPVGIMETHHDDSLGDSATASRETHTNILNQHASGADVMPDAKSIDKQDHISTEDANNTVDDSQKSEDIGATVTTQQVPSSDQASYDSQRSFVLATADVPTQPVNQNEVQKVTNYSEQPSVEVKKQPEASSTESSSVPHKQESITTHDIDHLIVGAEIPLESKSAERPISPKVNGNMEDTSHSAEPPIVQDASKMEPLLIEKPDEEMERLPSDVKDTSVPESNLNGDTEELVGTRAIEKPISPQKQNNTTSEDAENVTVTAEAEMQNESGLSNIRTNISEDVNSPERPKSPEKPNNLADDAKDRTVVNNAEMDHDAEVKHSVPKDEELKQLKISQGQIDSTSREENDEAAEVTTQPPVRSEKSIHHEESNITATTPVDNQNIVTNQPIIQSEVLQETNLSNISSGSDINVDTKELVGTSAIERPISPQKQNNTTSKDAENVTVTAEAEMQNESELSNIRTNISEDANSPERPMSLEKPNNLANDAKDRTIANSAEMDRDAEAKHSEPKDEELKQLKISQGQIDETAEVITQQPVSSEQSIQHEKSDVTTTTPSDNQNAVPNQPIIQSEVLQETNSSSQANISSESDINERPKTPQKQEILDVGIYNDRLADEGQQPEHIALDARKDDPIITDGDRFPGIAPEKLSSEVKDTSTPENEKTDLPNDTETKERTNSPQRQDKETL